MFNREDKPTYFQRSWHKILITAAILAALLYLVFVWGNNALEKRLPIKFQEQVEKYSAEYSLDKYLVYAIINTESGFDPEAESHAGAIGLMQLMPDTASWLNEKYSLGYDEINLKDPDQNVRMGCCYLAYLSNRFSSPELVFAAYNGGPNNVAKWLNNPEYSSDGKTLKRIPYEETSNYVKKVSVRYDFYKKLYS
ncbi:MAG: lytic transglycosylase domain-containing protein [Clostridia bacterium]|nr:lytic transglycosylase domain-containing protein [Clostridia bacterium]